MSVESRAENYGEITGDWKIQELLGIGSGGRTCVFRITRNRGFPEEGAVKIVNIVTEMGELERLSKIEKEDYESERERLYKRALDEITLMNKLEICPNIVGYHDWEYRDWVEGKQFGRDLLIRMDRLDTLADLENEGLFEEDEIILIGENICTALIECEQQGIIHRDIKPANIFKRRDRNSYLLGDFGISRIVDSFQYASTAIGTKPYAAPEQYYEKYDKRVDIYSLGLTLYELCNENCLPYAKSSRYVSEEQIAKRREAKQLPPFPKGRVSDELSEIILTACAHEPNKRYQTAQEFLNALTCATSHSKRRNFRNSNLIIVPPTDENLIPKAEEGSTELPLDRYATELARPGGGSEEEFAQKEKLWNRLEGTVTDFVIKDSILIKYNGPGGTIRIPDEVTKINYAAFRDRVDITQVLLPKGLNTIGGHAFSGCTKLTDVDISEGVTSIGGYAFSGCVSLVRAYIPSSVVAIEAYAFSKCISLSSVTIFDGVKKVGAYAFKGCNNLVDLSLPDSIIAIGTDAFSDCPNLTICGSGDSFAKKYAGESNIPFVESFEWLVRSAEQGDAYAQWQLGVRHMEGKGVPKDEKKAIEWYTKSAVQGYGLAQYALGDCYMEGKGVPQDKAKATELYAKSATQGYGLAQYTLGDCYMEGKGVPQDEAEAAKLYAKAVAQGHTKALSGLIKIAERGNVSAQFELGINYILGRGVSKDEAEAVKWFTAAANQGYAMAQINLGICYSFGKGVPKDEAAAVKWYTVAEDQGQSAAQYALGGIYMKGKGVPKDTSKAVELYAKSAVQGHKWAQHALADCYMEGKGVPKDEIKAIEWYKKAADQGQTDAQYKLAKCYMEGNGIQKDMAKAMELFTKVAETGDREVPELEHYYQDMQKKLSASSYIVKNIVYGTVSKINFKKGQKVQTGDVLFILNTSDSTTTKIKAPISGTVEFVAAYKTRKVSTGTFLAALSLPAQSVQLPKHDIVESTIPGLFIENGVLTKYDGNEQEIILPEGITEIREKAFLNCSQLTSITLPKSVSIIKENAFSNGGNQLTIYAVTGTYSQWYAENCGRSFALLTENGILTEYHSGKGYISHFKRIIIPNIVRKIGRNAFSRNEEIERVIIPESVREIGANAFWNCKYLLRVDIPKSVNSIGRSAFSGCYALTIHAPIKSYAQDYAKQYGISFSELS